MASLIRRRDPFSAFPAIDRMLSSMLAEPFNVGFGINTIEEGTLPLDISEDDTSVIVRASLPGFTKDQINVEVHDGVLTINAEKTEETEEKGERYYRKERQIGSMSRRVALPSIVEDGEASAEFKDGVLTLRLPKPAKASPRKISIS